MTAITPYSHPDKPPYPALAAAMDRIPQGSGVYLFKDADGRVLYVGKAVNLKNRLGSYLKTPEKHEPKTALMLKKMARVDVILTPTGREALILERNLIKEYRPRYNVMLRDDKNYLCLRLDLKESFPALRFVRRFHPDGALYFGPYSSAGMARETLKVMKQAFGVRTCKERRLAPRSRPCLEYQLAHCLGPCAGMVDDTAYRQAVQEAVLFLKGKGGHLLKRLKADMEQAAADLDFERAAVLRDRIQAIAQTLERQDMARPNFRDQDVLGLAEEAGQALIVVLVVRGGLVSGSREYFFPELPPDGDLLGAFLRQYYAEGRPLPEELLLPVDVPDRRLLEALFSDDKGSKVALSVAPGGEKARLLAMAADNARDALRRRRSPPDPGAALFDLQARLHLPCLPARLECLDISTLQGEQPVGALTAFTDGVPDKSRYRRFKIKEVEGQDDYAMLREVVTRHYGKAGQELPDLLVVDGGRGQLNVVTQTLKEMGLANIRVAGLAKAGENEGRPVRDRLFLPGRKNPLLPPANAPGWLLLLRLRDETHRFAITYHRKRARQEMLASILDQAPGIGPTRKRRLLSHFPNLDAVKAASLEEIAALPGFNQKVAAGLKEWLTETVT
ncbi:MAG: excinuclease ABC subunit UvrC [Syntrophobacterales bacterium]|jgi:excinuclease ABC subunit C|nr:excinuclease ABC subunit UvrC [Syntrophobacterales bacterium]